MKDTGHDVRLTTGEIARIIELLNDYRDEVKSGDVVGFGQSREEELADVGWLLDKLSTAR